MRPLSSLRAVFSKGQIAGVMRTRVLASILWAFNFARTSANPVKKKMRFAAKGNQPTLFRPGPFPVRARSAGGGRAAGRVGGSGVGHHCGMKSSGVSPSWKTLPAARNGLHAPLHTHRNGSFKGSALDASRNRSLLTEVNEGTGETRRVHHAPPHDLRNTHARSAPGLWPMLQESRRRRYSRRSSLAFRGSCGSTSSTDLATSSSPV